MWLQYGATAAPIGDPDRTFGYLGVEDPRFGTFQTEFISVVDVGLYEDEGKIELSAVKDRLYRRFSNGFQELELSTLLEVLREETIFSEEQMRVVVLYGWFDMDAERTAEFLGWEPTDVETHVDEILEKRDRAERTATITFLPD